MKTDVGHIDIAFLCEAAGRTSPRYYRADGGLTPDFSVSVDEREHLAVSSSALDKMAG